MFLKREREKSKSSKRKAHFQPHTTLSGFFNRNLVVQRERKDKFKVLKEKYCQLRTLYTETLYFRNEER